MTGAERPTVSVVVAAHGTARFVEECLDAHERELGEGDEILLVTDEREAPYAADAARRPRVRVLDGGAGANTPRLWAAGIAASRGAAVRVTIAPIVPVAGWRRRIDDAFAGGVDALGGAIDGARPLRLRDWAVLFLRYHRYLPPWEARRSSDVAGDHAMYRRGALDACRTMWEAEFWETEVNARLAREGRTLALDPEFAALYRGGESAAWLLGMRWSHGVRFGRVRASTASPVRRLVHALVFVLPGAVFFAKIARSVLGRGGRLGRFVLAVPWMAAFLLAWSLGEWVGWIRGPRA